MTADGLRTVEEAAEWLGIGVSTLRKLVAARQVPHTRIGRAERRVRFAQHHLDAIVAAGEASVIRAPLRVVPIRPADSPRPPSNPPAAPRPPAGPSTPPPPAGPKASDIPPVQAKKRGAA